MSRPPTVRRAEDRFRTDDHTPGAVTFHSFSYGRHYDADNISFGPVMAINTEHLAPGAGYDEHHHSDVEIVTWVLEGTLEHRDSTGTHGLVRPGTLQRLSAGSGVSHTERNVSADEPLVFVQMMVRSDHDGAPRYADANAPTIDVHAPATLRVLTAGTYALPGPLLVHVTRGTLTTAAHRLAPGDEIRSDAPLDLELEHGAEALAWLLDPPR